MEIIEINLEKTQDSQLDCGEEIKFNPSPKKQNQHARPQLSPSISAKNILPVDPAISLPQLSTINLPQHFENSRNVHKINQVPTDPMYFGKSNATMKEDSVNSLGNLFDAIKYLRKSNHTLKKDGMDDLEVLLNSVRVSSGGYNEKLELIYSSVKQIEESQKANLTDVLYQFFSRGISPFGETTSYDLSVITDCLSKFFEYSQVKAFIDNLINNYPNILSDIDILKTYKKFSSRYRSSIVKIRRELLAQHFKEYFEKINLK